MIDSRHMIAKNIAGMLHDGDFVNLGVGMPTLVSTYIPKDITVLLHGENGCVGQDKIVGHVMQNNLEWERANSGENEGWKTGHKDMGNAGGDYITLIPGGCCFDSSVSFAMARGGHLDATVLGALQVDQEGNLANWMVPGKSINGVGGAMDIVSGAKKVIIAMEHCTKQGGLKLMKKCTMPLTAMYCVDTIVTELCIIEIREKRFVVTVMAPGITKEVLQEKTEAELLFADEIKTMTLPE